MAANDHIGVGRVASQCQTCRHWTAPVKSQRAKRPDKTQRPGRCGLDNGLSHAGYSCGRFTYRPEVLVKILGVSDAELAWLQAHPDDPVTKRLRKRLHSVQDAGASLSTQTAFVAALDAWRSAQPSRR